MGRPSAMSPHSTLSAASPSVSPSSGYASPPSIHVSMSKSKSMSGLAFGLPPPPLLSPSSGSTSASASASASTSTSFSTSTATATAISASTSSPGKRRPYPRHSLPSAAMPEYRHVRSGSLNIPNGAGAAASNSSSSLMPRSPPNTSHVPCKFFRQGACQAGNACPFSHDLGASAENICKYFAKGNCKFGPKCANIHVLPDGRRINYGKNGVTIGTTPIGLAGRPSPSPASPTSASSSGYHQSSASALTTSLYGAEQSPWDDRQVGNPAHHPAHQPSLDNAIPSLDSPYAHSNYGSPREDDPTRLGFGLSILDAPLPASFDSNGISNAARFPAAPWPSSVPSKFGFESPTPSLGNGKDSRTSETLKLLHTSAFGSSDHLTPTVGSPPNSQSAIGDEYFGRRAMHSSRYAKPRMLSSSMPKTSSVDRDWEAEFAFDDDNLPENYVPENLQELLTPAEKARRGSSSMRDEHAIEALRYGSPMGTSPSRWGSLFQRQKEEEDAARAARSAGSVFGHVGSPLRKSTLAQEMGDDYKSPGTANRLPTARSTSDSMSVLSQQLQRSRLDDAISGSGSSPHLHPTTARLPHSSLASIGRDRAMERHVSSGSIGSSVTGRFTTPIDEEDQAFVFSMEEEDEAPSTRMRKRISAGLSMGALGSYASAVAGKSQSSGGSKENRDSVPVNGR